MDTFPFMPSHDFSFTKVSKFELLDFQDNCIMLSFVVFSYNSFGNVKVCFRFVTFLLRRLKEIDCLSNKILIGKP